MNWNLISTFGREISSLAATAAFIGGIFVTVNGFLQRRTDAKKLQFDKSQWKVDLYVRPKLEALRRLHTALVKSHYQLNRHALAYPPRTEEEYQRFIEAPKQEFFDALIMSEIYLESTDSVSMHAVLGALRQFAECIRYNIGREEPKDATQVLDWNLFTTTFEDAHARLKVCLHPTGLAKEFTTSGEV